MRAGLLVLLVVVVLVRNVQGGTLGYNLNGVTQQPIDFNDLSPDVEIDLSGSDLSGSITLHIFGAGTAGRETNVGLVTVRGRKDPNASFLEFRVIVADSTETSAFSAHNTLRVHGFKNFGGLRFVGPRPTQPTVRTATTPV